MHILSTQKLVFSHSEAVRFQFPDIQLRKGEHHLILGKSGCGKTTLLHILAGILQPDAGEMRVLGEAIYDFSERARDAFRGKHLGLIFQQPHLIPSLSVYQNVRIAAYLAQKDISDAEIYALLSRLSLSDKKHHFPSQISQGEAQRVAIARALIHHPTIVFADEPTSGLDDENCQAVVQLLLAESQHFGATLIIVTHDKRLKEQFKNTILL